MPEWIVEPLASEEDIDAVMAVEEASFTNPWTREMYRSELRNPGVSFFFVVRDRGRAVLAFCSFWLVADELHINNLAVLPAWRRQGIARALLTRVLYEASRLGATRAFLEVRRSNDAARHLYEGLGFSTAGTRRDYYSQPVEDAIVLTREDLAAGPSPARRP